MSGRVVGNSLLRLEGLAKRFPNGRGVGPLTLGLEPGIHGLLGPNGSGKTTLVKTLLGFHKPDAGHGMLLGQDIQADPIQVRRHVGYMAENDVFVPGLNAAQTVRLAAELCGLAPAAAHEASAEALHAVGLGEEAFHSPARLSTGQRQKMKLAAALVHAPRLLILDEPTNGLDPGARRVMLTLIRELADERDISVLLSTHILPDVEALCSSAVILADGKLAGIETIEAASAAPSNGKAWFALETLGDRRDLEAVLRKAGHAVRDQSGTLEAESKDVATLLRLAHKEGHVLTRAAPAKRSAADAILERLEVKA